MIPLPEGVELEEFPGGVRIHMPRRKLGAARFFGFFPMGFGALFIGFALSWMYGASGLGSGKAPGLNIIFALFGIPFLLAGLVPFVIGLFILFGGRSVVTVTQNDVREEERLGPIRKSWKRPLDGLKAVDVGFGVTKINGRPVENSVWSDISAVRFDFGEAKPFVAAPVYPRALVTPVTEEIARRIRAMRPDLSLPEVGLVEERGFETARKTLAGEVIDAPAEKPVDSRITLDRRADGVTIDIPPGGFRRGGAFLVFGLVWIAIVAAVSIGMLSGGGNGPPLLFAIPFLSIFWAVGIGLLLGALHAMRVRYIVDVIGPRGDTRQMIMLTKGGLFGTTQKEWKRDEVETIQVGPSGMSQNNQPILEVQVVLKGGGKQGILAGAKVEELHWVAWELRSATEVPAGDPVTSD